MSLRKALLAATVLSLPAVAAGVAPARAQPIEGLYVGAGAGWNWTQDADIDLTGLAANRLRVGVPFSNPSGTLEFEDGWTGVLSLGWGFRNGLRAELEGFYRQNDLDSVSGFGASRFGVASGEVRSWGLMVNLLYELNLERFGLARSFVQPYVGGGVGWARIRLDDVRARTPGGAQLIIDDEDDRFAYQGIVGAAFPLTQWVPGLAITAEYRFFGTLQPEVNSTVILPNGTRGGSKVETDYLNHSVLLGVRYAFNQPRPAPAPAPVPAVQAPPEVARTYLVFFDWDRADLTDRARQIIAEAAQNSRRVQTTRIEVAGHADRSGSAEYNQRLSQRRADNVAAELVRNGVPRNEIVVTAFGESRPLVPTADGVREPQNRRVEIVLR